MIREALRADFERELRLAEEEFPLDHKFSRRHLRQMKRLFALSGENSAEKRGRHIPLKKAVVIALIAVLLTAILTGASMLIYKLWDNYRIRDLDLYSLLEITDIENAPTTLEQRYELGIDLSGYKRKVHIDECFEFMAEYTNENEKKHLVFEQTTKDVYQNVFLNTEDAIVPPVEVEINGYKGLFFESKYEDMVYIMDIDDYMFEIAGGGFTREELAEIVKTIRKTDK